MLRQDDRGAGWTASVIQQSWRNRYAADMGGQSGATVGKGGTLAKRQNIREPQFASARAAADSVTGVHGGRGSRTTRGATRVSVTIDHILAAFDEAGMRNTRPRRLIAERLAACAARGVDFTADDLWHELLDIEPSLGRATVFRAIETLVGLKQLDRVTFADGTHRYRVCGTAHHHHLTCVGCHRVIEIETCLPMEQFHAIASRNDFALEGHALELYGRCAECREAPPDAPMRADAAS